MHENNPLHGKIFPLPAVIFFVSVALFAVGLTVYARVYGLPESTYDTPVLVSLKVQFDKMDDGTIAIRKPGEPDILFHLTKSGQLGFLSPVLTAHTSERRQYGIDKDAPYVMIMNHTVDRRLIIIDPPTPYHVHAEAFGDISGGLLRDIFDAVLLATPDQWPAAIEAGLMTPGGRILPYRSTLRVPLSDRPENLENAEQSRPETAP